MVSFVLFGSRGWGLAFALVLSGCAARQDVLACPADQGGAQRDRSELEQRVARLEAENASLKAALASQVKAQPALRPELVELDVGFTEEPIDRSWAEGAEKSLRGMLEAQEREGTRVVFVQCRTTRCYVQAAPSSATAKRKLEQFMRSRPTGFAGSLSWSDEGPEGTRSMHYLLRAGAKWPEAGASLR